MEAKELMINDLLKVTKGNLIGRVCDINQSRDFVGYCNIDAEETYLEASYMKYIEPIPLTEDILRSNGFEEYRGGLHHILRYRFMTETDVILIEPMNVESSLGNKWYWFSNHDRELKAEKTRLTYPFVYVHQLQHALRLCGMGEVADNFKV